VSLVVVPALVALAADLEVAAEGIAKPGGLDQIKIVSIRMET
jgi:hypothetical protein